MLGHIRGNVMLLVLTLLVCCVLYPAVLWAIGQTLFHDQAQGSLIGPDGKPTSDEKKAVGSRLIAQAFGNDEHFQPRPSSGSYNGASSGGSNLAASNPALRGRAAQQIGPIVRYRSPKGPGKGDLVGDDVVKWFKAHGVDDPKTDKPHDLPAEWAANNGTLLTGWATSSDPIKDYITQWGKDHKGVPATWKTKHQDVTTDPKPEDLAPFFFDPSVEDSFVKLNPGMWPTQTKPDANDSTNIVVKPDDGSDASSSDIQTFFFDTWLQAHGDKLKDMEPVPADLVTTSGSGLDPDISLRGAQYQARRVIDAQVGLTTKALQKMLDDLAKESAKPTPEAATRELERITAELTGDDKTPGAVEKLVDDLLKEKASTPMFGLIGGEPLVNVLETNLALDARVSDLEKKLEARLKAKASTP